MTGELPTMSKQDARAYFIARYQTIWGTHPAAKTHRKDDPSARYEREMWGAVIDGVEPDQFERLMIEVQGVLTDMERKGKPTLEDFKKAAAKLYQRHVAEVEEKIEYVAAENKPISRAEYLRANEHRHQGSATFAELWRREFGKAWTGNSGQRTPAPAPGPGFVRPGEVDDALEPDEYEMQERAAMQNEEPW